MMSRDRRKTGCSKPTAGFVSRQHGPDKPRHALRPSGPRNDERLRTGVTSKRQPDDGTRFVCSSAARAVTCRRRSFGTNARDSLFDLEGAGLLEHKRAFY